MEFIKNVFKYFFSPAPGSEFSFYIPVIILAVLLIIGSVVFSIIYKKKKRSDFAYKRLFKKLAGRCSIFAIIFLFLIGLRYENIPYFAMRLWIYLAAGVFLYFVYRYAKILKVDYPKEKANLAHKHKISNGKKEVNSYLPSKKKRK